MFLKVILLIPNLNLSYITFLHVHVYDCSEYRVHFYRFQAIQNAIFSYKVTFYLPNLLSRVQRIFYVFLCNALMYMWVFRWVILHAICPLHSLQHASHTCMKCERTFPTWRVTYTTYARAHTRTHTTNLQNKREIILLCISWSAGLSTFWTTLRCAIASILS